LTVENLANVMEQNELPAPAEQAERQLSLLREHSETLLRYTQGVSQLFGDVTGGRVAAPAHDQREVKLRELMNSRRPLWDLCDIQRGSAYGTAARSLAFCGELEQALERALEARRFFGDSPVDLQINACNMARIRAEQARLGMLQPKDELLTLLVDLAGGIPLYAPQGALEAFQSDSGSRFVFDLVLRRLLWNVPMESRAEFKPLLDSLKALDKSPLYSWLRDQRSHPTELIARHAAELLRQQMAGTKAIDAWFDLSIQLTESAPGKTLQRFAMFTRSLKDGRGADGPPGSIMNPTFEYR
jgi:hypothetical protein